MDQKMTAVKNACIYFHLLRYQTPTTAATRLERDQLLVCKEILMLEE